MRMNSKLPSSGSLNCHHQRGNVLIISLILLAALTLFGLSSMRSTLLEQRIAINQQDQHRSIEGAQSALAVAKRRISDVSANRPLLTDKGYWLTLGGGRAAPDLASWTSDTSYQLPSSQWGSDTERPRYKIEDFAAPSSDLDLGTGETVAAKRVRSTTYYRISGRGTGVDSRNDSIVETVVVKELAQ